MRPLKKNVSFRLRGKREIIKFGDSSTFYDTLFCNSLPATERNDPLCRKFLLLDQISREIGKIAKRNPRAVSPAESYYEQPYSLCKDITRPLKKNVSFRLRRKREIVKFGDSTFYDTLFHNSLPATERNNPLCWKFLLLDKISREIGKSHS
ncbi:hypothetical protein CDAR_418741 [Caerostris darwini]|uniref:Uncharacterized protein n=1 Tax=Caerostris darwini TaxID=1538125 RepID=A0AAV4MVJ4_9ARAC|nr:hypothetical protein CDAR_418741 [Caerostris darwini]